MTATNTELSITILCVIQKTLNNIIESSGEIKINNKTIWDGFLHQMDNAVWRGCLETLAVLNDQHPELFSLNHYAAISDGLTALDKFDQYYDKVLDMNTKHIKHKGTAWKCLMTIREVLNNCQGINIPNKDTSKVKTTFGSIFE